MEKRGIRLTGIFALLGLVAVAGCGENPTQATPDGIEAQFGFESGQGVKAKTSLELASTSRICQADPQDAEFESGSAFLTLSGGAQSVNLHMWSNGLQYDLKNDGTVVRSYRVRFDGKVRVLLTPGITVRVRTIARVSAKGEGSLSRTTAELPLTWIDDDNDGNLELEELTLGILGIFPADCD